jgi:hypothetical protein
LFPSSAPPPEFGLVFLEKSSVEPIRHDLSPRATRYRACGAGLAVVEPL